MGYIASATTNRRHRSVRLCSPLVSSPACWSREEPLPRNWDCPPPCARGLSLPSSAIRRYLLI
jgi:hypothetical protein